MALAGASASAATVPLNAPPLSSTRRAALISVRRATTSRFSTTVSATPSKSAATISKDPVEFHYPLSDPSVRWPNLDLHDYSESPPPFPTSTSSSPPPTPTSQTTLDEKQEENVHETLADKQSRTRVKKMTKLALKRAKDWRERVQLLVDRILALPESAPVADVLDARVVQTTPADLAVVVKLLGRSSWRRALETFEWLTLRRRHAPEPRLLAAVISTLGRARQPHIAAEIFERADPEALTVQVYNAMMGVYARVGRFSDVQELVDVMRARRVEPDLVSFNTLINARAKSGQMPAGAALELLAEVQRAGLRPDAITYNTIISACAQAANLEDAVKVFKQMSIARCEPDLWTYNAMVSVYGRCGLAREAQLLFDELGRKGFNPDAVTYNSLLFAYAKDGVFERVGRICDEMMRAGFKKDEITFNTIIHMYGKMGRLDLAMQLYQEMKLTGCNPDAVTYTVLIDSLGKADRIMEAEMVMSEMMESQVRPTLRTFSSLICGYAKAGMRGEAERTFDVMVRSGIKPDRLVYSVVLDVLLRASEVRKAMVFYRDMKRDGFGPDEGLYQVLLGVLGKENRTEDIVNVVKDMEEASGMSPQVISSLLVKGECFFSAAEMLKQAVAQGHDLERESLFSILTAYSSSGRHTEAHALIGFLREHAPCGNHVISEASILMLCENHQLQDALDEYNNMRMSFFQYLDGSCSLYESLIKCCGEAEFFYEASQLYSDMSFLGLEPTQDIYKNMTVIYCKLGFPETAHHLVDQAENAGILFNDLSVYVNLIETYGRLKQWQKAESFVGKLRQHSVVDRRIWNALIHAYAESGRYEQARAIFNTMMRDGPHPSVDSVNGLMQALIVDGRLPELYVVVKELQDMDFKISKSTVLMMLDAFARDGNIFEVKKIYYGMKAAGYLPTMHLYRSMIGLLCQGKRVRDVELMITEMEEAGFKPDLAIFNSLLKMYIKIEDFRKTVEVYQRIQEAALKPDEDTYNTLVIMYSRDMRSEEGLSLLNQMKRQGLEPKLDTYKSLLAACAREKLWEQAEELFERMRSKGRRLDRSVYHTMIKMYRDSGNYSKAEHMLSLMKSAGLEPTIATMHMIMVSYGTAGQPQEAENVLNNLKTSGLEVTTLPYSSVIDAYLKNGDYNLGIQKLSEMKEDGLEPDHRVWTCFIRAASLCQETDQAMILLNSMSNSGFDLPIRLLTQKVELLIAEVDHLLGELGPMEDNAAFNFVNAVEDLLWAFERRATASWLFQLAVKKSIYRHDIFRVAEKDWGADFRKLSAGAALVGLTLWLDHMQDASLQGIPESPKSVVLITGNAEYHMVSLNKTLKAYLWEMGSPFLPCKTRSGVLVAKAHSLRMWLKDSSFCMDLELKDALFLPKSNAMKLTEGYFMRAGLVPAFMDIHARLGQVRPKKFARLTLLSAESRDKVIQADIEGRKEKLEKMKKAGMVRARKPTRLRTGKFMRRRHKAER